MTYGIGVWDKNGVQTLSMDDFTIRRLYSGVIAAQPKAGGVNFRSDYIVINIPGYNPATCFVTITPRAYAGVDQVPQNENTWPSVPTYVDLGGSSIGICTWTNYGVYDGNRWKYFWKAFSVECTVEVVRVT